MPDSNKSRRTCPTCGGPYDPAKVHALRVGELMVRLENEAAFKAAWPRLHCPACRKRLSPESNSIDASSDGPTVRMHCHHCDHRFEVARGGVGSA